MMPDEYPPEFDLEPPDVPSPTLTPYAAVVQAATDRAASLRLIQQQVDTLRSLYEADRTRLEVAAVGAIAAEQQAWAEARTHLTRLCLVHEALRKLVAAVDGTNDEVKPDHGAALFSTALREAKELLTACLPYLK